MMQFKSIKTKLSVCFGVLLILICAGIGVISYMTSANALSSNIDESLAQLSKEASRVVKGKVDIKLSILETLAESDSIKNEKSTLNAKLGLLQNEAKRNSYLMMGIADIFGNVKYTNGESVSISGMDYFKAAISGKSTVSDPIINDTGNIAVLYYATPIKDGNAVKGVLVAACDGNELSTFMDDIHFGKNGEAFMINKTGTTIAHKDKNLVLKMDNDFENVKKDPDLTSLVNLEKLMTEKKEGAGEYTYKGVTKYMGFAPVEGTNWSLAITAPKSEVMEKVDDLAKTMLIVSINFLVVNIAITFMIASNISKPIKAASDYLKVVATGNLTAEVSTKLLKAKDETGTLANSMQTMQSSIKNIVKKVIEESSNVGQMLNNIHNEMERLNNSIEGISATTEELSAETEETASSTEEMNATTTEIEKAIESIASSAQEGAITVSNVSKMSEEMKQNAMRSKENTIGIYGKTKNNLQSAIEQSKAVYQINELSESILTIASQTNLLALNAAIEAARAGEAGKGFAVVADEIRNLAEDSKNMVESIQEATKVILEAVNNLSDSSVGILDFIDKQILNEYEYLVKASEQNSQNSSSINDMVTDFSSTSEELLASIQNMVEAISEITNASNEEAQGATDIAQEVSAIMQMSNNVIKLAKSAEGKSNLLIKSVSQFKV